MAEELWHPWDTLMKLLIREEVQALASLALPGVRVGDALDKELKVKNIEGDFFFDADLDDLEIILHFEFQKGQDSEMDRRMWEYNATMDIISGKRVYSILVYLVKEENLVGSPYVRGIPGTGTGHHFVFHIIKLWEIWPEVLKQTGIEGLLPLLPLTKGGKSLETVDDMITQLVTRNRSDLLALARGFASLIFTDEREKQWLRERFSKVLPILKQSWAYQETFEEGRKEALQQTAIEIFAARFPELEQLTRVIIAAVSDVERLQKFIVDLSISSSQEHAKQLLLSLV